MNRTIQRTLSALSAIFLLLSSSLAISQAPAKKKILSEADLPRFSYPIATPASVLIQADDPTFNAFDAKVLADVDSVLTGYDIEDKSTLRQLNQLKLNILELQNRDEEAASTLRTLIALQEKPDARQTTGLIDQPFLDAATQTHATTGDAYTAAFQKALQTRVAALDWPVAQDFLKFLKADLETVTPNLVIGVMKQHIDPAVAKSNSVDFAAATRMVDLRNFVKISVDHKEPILAVLTPYILAHNIQKPDIWEAREVTSPPPRSLPPSASASGTPASTPPSIPPSSSPTPPPALTVPTASPSTCTES